MLLSSLIYSPLVCFVSFRAERVFWWHDIYLGPLTERTMYYPRKRKHSFRVSVSRWTSQFIFNLMILIEQNLPPHCLSPQRWHLEEFGLFGFMLFTTDRLFLCKLFVTVTSRNNPTNNQSLCPIWHLGSLPWQSPRDAQCICLTFSSSSLPLCFIEHGHILWRSQCFPKVSPAWWLDRGQLWTAAGLQLNDSDWLWLVYRLASFENRPRIMMENRRSSGCRWLGSRIWVCVEALPFDILQTSVPPIVSEDTSHGLHVFPFLAVTFGVRLHSVTRCSRVPNCRRMFTLK